MSTPTPATPASEPLGLRVLRSLVAIALAIALVIIFGLAAIAWIPVIGASSNEMSGAMRLGLLLALLLAVVGPIVLMVVAARRRWLTWIGLAVGWLAVLPILWWLSSDDPAVRDPVSMEEFSPAVSGADQSFATLMRYSRASKDSEAQAFAALKLAVPAFGVQPSSDAAKWTAFVTQHRAELEQDWAALAPQRQWIDQLASYDSIGDLTPDDLQFDIPSFQVWRTLAYHCSAIATLQAADGHGDEALATVLPLLAISRRLQTSSRTLIRSAVAENLEQTSLATVGLVLDRASTSPAVRQRVAEALGPENGALQAWRLVMVDYVRYAPRYLQMRMGDALVAGGRLNFLRLPLNFFSSLFLNPNRTMNRYGDHVRDIAALAKARKVGEVDARNRAFLAGLSTPFSMKNLVGRLMIAISQPAFQHLLEMHWRIADLRVALRHRLAQPS